MEVIPKLGMSGLTENQRSFALGRFHILSPLPGGWLPLARIAQENHLHLRTLTRWADNYRLLGTCGGLCRTMPVTIRTSAMANLTYSPATHRGKLISRSRGLAASSGAAPGGTIAAARLGEPVPSYRTVHRVIQAMEPALMMLAHEGTKSYENRFDLIHRREAEKPNAMWQADHTELDILVKDDEDKPRRPWLTIILDDYSRAVAGYMLFFSGPSAVETALAIRQAIWRKCQPGWHVCGIPQILYIDHGSDFTSHHIEQVTADLKIRLIYSTVGKPRGRGKIERFFDSLAQVFLSRLPGYARDESDRAAVLTLPQLTEELERYLISEYLVTPHSATGQAPQARWDAGGFLPNLAESLEQLDLLLLTEAKTRRVQPDGISFMGMRYIDPTLAAYVREEVMLRYDPRDMAEVRVFYQDRFLCRAVCQELAGETVALREIVNARSVTTAETCASPCKSAAAWLIPSWRRNAGLLPSKSLGRHPSRPSPRQS